MKIQTSALLGGALLAILFSGSAFGATCACDCPPKHAAHAAVRHAPAHMARQSADAEYAQSYYNYGASGAVNEVLVQRIAVAPRPAPWVVAPNDGYVGGYDAYQQQGYYAPPAPYAYGPVSVGYSEGQAFGVRVDDHGFSGGVGYGDEGGGGGGGGGYGGQAFVYGGAAGGQNEPSNGGGVNLPAGYGRDYHGNWQGYVPPGQMSH